MRLRAVPVALLALAAAAVPAGAEPNLPAGATLPVLRSQIPAGGGQTVTLADSHDGVRQVDGDTSDWGGSLPGFGGASMYSHGELVYQDHLFDADGADDGQDTQRLAIYDQTNSFAPELYRVDGALTQYAPGELGVPTGPIESKTRHGDLPFEDDPSLWATDLSELRVASDDQNDLWVLARTTTMTAPTTALLILLDTTPGDTKRTVPFNSGLTTTKGDVAVLITNSGTKVADLATGDVSDLAGSEVAYDPSGFNNSIEARLPSSVLQGATKPGIAVATGLDGGNGTLKSLGDATSNPQGVNVANVAFRPDEPAREWWDRQQGLELYKKTMDAFFTTADIGRMHSGATERYVPTTGYHEAIFTSTPNVSDENRWDHGLTQRYGVYLPTRYDEDRPTPTQFWFHFRGGSAHVAAHVVPGVFWDMGEAVDSIVITPDGRGTSGWYVGKSGVDVQQVWDDSHKRFAIDRNRTYISGHSMGGWASWLLPVMHPDWWAGSLPASPPPTQGAWVGFTDDQISGCDRYTYSDYSPCFVQANGGDAKAEWTYPLLDNLREVPVAVYEGNQDELVPATGVTLMMKKLTDLGYRNRYYLFEGQEHYGPPAVDQWAEGTQYLHQFERNPNPQQVTYIRSMVFENAIESVNTEGMPEKPNFDLSHAYWMSGLEAVDPVKGIARFDGESLGLPKTPHTLEPEADTAPHKGNAAPYVMEGQRWVDDPTRTSPTSNAFKVTLTGAKAVTLHLGRMKLSTGKELDGTVSTDGPLALSLTDVAQDVTVTIGGNPVPATRDGDTLTIDVPQGANQQVVITPVG